MSSGVLEGQNLVEVLAALRSQLVEARRQGEGQDLRFSLEDIEIELSFQVSKDATAKGGVKFWVVTADLGGKVANEAVQKIKLKMKLSDPDQSEPIGFLAQFISRRRRSPQNSSHEVSSPPVHSRADA